MAAKLRNDSRRVVSESISMIRSIVEFSLEETQLKYYNESLYLLRRSHVCFSTTIAVVSAFAPGIPIMTYGLLFWAMSNLIEEGESPQDLFKPRYYF